MIYDFYDQFPDVHQNIVLKIALNRVGVSFSEDCMKSFQERDDILWKGYHFFSYDMRDHPRFYREHIPVFLWLKDGSVVYERTNPNSPFMVDYRDGNYCIFENNEIIANGLRFAPKPIYYGMHLEDGTPLPAIVNAFGDENLFITLYKYCEFWTKNDQCLFCDISATLRAQKESQEETIIAQKDPSILTNALKIIRAVDPRYSMLYISSGTILNMYRNQTELEFQISRLNAIREGLGGIWFPTCVQMAAYPKKDLKKLYKETGVPSYQPNIEVSNEELFKWICPGKAKYIGWNNWIKRTTEAVDIWGKGKVQPNFVIGVDMAKPHGFKDVASAVKSMRKIWELLMSNGVIPRYANWTISGLSAFRDQEYPPMEYYVEIEKLYFELRQKYNYDPPFPGALTRTSYAHSCIWDFEYYHGTGCYSKKDLQAKGCPVDIIPIRGNRGYKG